MSKHSITIEINGESVTREVDSRKLLIHFIRDDLALTGTHIGCDTSSCGACTVLLNGKSIKACTFFAVQANNQKIETIEGVEQGGQLHRLLDGFHQELGLQCGFCTPGMIMRGKELLEKNPNPTEDEIRWGISGNLCRCTGYSKIIKSFLYAANKLNEKQEEAA